METQDTWKGRLKVGDVFKSTRATCYYRIVGEDTAIGYYVGCKPLTLSFSRHSIVQSYRNGTLLRIPEEELLIAILTGKVLN